MTIADEQATLGISKTTFDDWLVEKSYSLLPPICRMGILVLAAVVLFYDVFLYASRTWETNVGYAYLIAWHLLAFFVFGYFYAAIRLGWASKSKRGHLAGFILLVGVLSATIGMINWWVIRDLSIYAAGTLTLAATFNFPGYTRRLIYLATAIALGGFILYFDLSGHLVGGNAPGEIVNLVSVVAICFLVDAFMMRRSEELYNEKRLVEAERARADSVLYNAFPVSIADELKKNKVVKAEKFEKLTVMFTDIVGFTKFSSGVPADAVVFVLNQIFSTFDVLAEARGLEKIKTIGDAYMVVGKGGPAAMAELALDMMDAIADYNRKNGAEFSLRIGIHLGPAVAGVIGLKRFLYDVWGDTVNMASRMESTGIAGKIQVSDTVRESLSSSFTFEDRGKIEMKGKGLVQTYFLLGKAA